MLRLKWSFREARKCGPSYPISKWWDKDLKLAPPNLHFWACSQVDGMGATEIGSVNSFWPEKGQLQDLAFGTKS